MKKLARTLKALHRDEGGADMVEYILIVAAIALPLLAIAIIFRDELWEVVSGFWEDNQGDVDMR